MCENEPTNCTLPCDPTCKECGLDGKCTKCEDGKFLNTSKLCEECDKK